MPGGSRYHHASCETAPLLNAESNWEPQETRNGSLRPRKASADSVRIAPAIVSVVFASTRGMTLGRMCLLIWWRCPAPGARPRSRYGLDFTARVWERMMRAVPGHE